MSEEKKWPETVVQRLTQEQYNELVNTNISMVGTEVCELFTKLKIVVRSLQVEATITGEQANVADAMICEFVASLKQHSNPDSLVNVDELFGRLLAYTVKSCMTPGAIVEVRRSAEESVH